MFLHLAVMLHWIIERTGGRNKEKKRLSVWRFHISAFPLLARLNISFLFCFYDVLAISCRLHGHVNSGIVLFMKERREDMERALAESILLGKKHKKLYPH